jgi:hypothetical protein
MKWEENKEPMIVFFNNEDAQLIVANKVLELQIYITVLEELTLHN